MSTDYRNPFSATFHGILDLFKKREPIGKLDPELRLDGKTCLVTGANSGMGRAIAGQLARRGANVIMACRSGIPEAGEALSRETGSDKIRMLRLDLADLDAVAACCAELKADGVKLDRLILNAGLVPLEPTRTRQGFEMMFGVHFIGNMALVQGLLADGTLPRGQDDLSRIVFVSSETHRSGRPLDFASFGEFHAYSATGSIAQYGHSKLAMTVFAMELAERLRGEVAVHAVCPGPINSGIARDAPGAFKPLLGLVMKALFASPDKAAEPVMFLACAPQIAEETGIYLHLMARKDPAPAACDPQCREQVWRRGQELVAKAASAT